MFNLELLNIFDDELSFDSKSVSLSTDSRTFDGEEVFICLTGESFDGFDFIEDVLSVGCEVVIFKNTDSNIKKVEEISCENSNVTFIGVDSPLIALQEIAKERIQEFKNIGGQVFGITGSNGKTTTKEMLFSLLSSVFGSEVHCTKGNFNNHIGVPLTILSASEECRYMIIEMGANHVGEIGLLCEIAMPDHGIISSVGAAHIGLFGGIENIFKEKKSLYDFVLSHKVNNSKFVINKDDKYLAKIEDSEILVKFSEKDSLNHIEIDNPNIHEKYNINNLRSALLLCLNIFPSEEQQFKKAASNYTIPSLNRSEWIDKNDKTFFLDAYNANPTSMESSLLSFVDNMKIRKVPLDKVLFVLGDMNELGEYTQAEHKRIAEMIESIGAKNVIFVGNYANYYKEGLSTARVFNCKSELEKEWPSLLKKCSAVFIKASRSLQLESLVDIT